MTFFNSSLRIPLVAVSAAALMTAGCNRDREAEAETPVSEAEVSTELPPSVVSEEQLEATANAAAEIAATPPPEMVAVPVPVGNGTQSADRAGTAGPGAAPATNTATR